MNNRGAPRPPGSNHPAEIAAVAVLVVLVVSALAAAAATGRL
ncbi:MAG: hypothetical protein WBB62_13965 [Rhodococcus sp. (in: high G+C Gram-positive bacteria)]|nr:hypothetical protein [Rhodococcus sp. KRD197]